MAIGKSMLSRRTILISSLLMIVCIGYIGLAGNTRVIFRPLPIGVTRNDSTVASTSTVQNEYSVENTFMPLSGSTWSYAPEMRNYSTVREKQTGKFEITKFKPHAFKFFKKASGWFIVQKWRIRNGKFHPEDLMKAGPFKFLPNYRNPCWAISTKQLPPIKCLPYYYLMGAPKSGTTDLHSRITRHPSVSIRTPKEPHWLPRSHYFNKPLLDNYTSIFRNAAKDIYKNKDENDWHRKIFGDCSASTLWDNDYWTMLPEFDNLTEPLYTNADYIHHLNPNTKFIAILRNPIDRLYSDYLYFGSVKKSPQMFHDVVVEAIDYMKECLKNRSLRFCVYHRPPESALKVRLRIGIYSIHLKEFLRVFPRNQVLVLYLEEYSKNITMAMKKVFQFLELEHVNATHMKSISFKAHKNARRAKDKAIGEMLPETRELLRQFYHPYNLELSELLGNSFNFNDLG